MVSQIRITDLEPEDYVLVKFRVRSIKPSGMISAEWPSHGSACFLSSSVYKIIKTLAVGDHVKVRGYSTLYNILLIDGDFVVLKAIQDQGSKVSNQLFIEKLESLECVD